MKKTLTTFLLLVALFTSITPIQPPFGSDSKPEISICGDDDNDPNIILNE